MFWESENQSYYLMLKELNQRSMSAGKVESDLIRKQVLIQIKNMR